MEKLRFFVPTLTITLSDTLVMFPIFTKSITTTAQTDSARLTSRDVIYDGELANLEKVEPLNVSSG